MLDLNQIWVDIECPKCNYSDIIQLVDVKTERLIFCHNCKVSIQLVDSEASIHQGAENINNALKDLENMFKNFGK